ncbi:MAG: sensor histidine kinase [Thermoplasmatota archaeon]
MPTFRSLATGGLGAFDSDRATLWMFALMVVAGVALLAAYPFNPTVNGPEVVATATVTIAFILLAFLHARGWRPARFVGVLVVTAAVGLALQEPLVTERVSDVILIPPALALVVAGPGLIIAAALGVYVTLLVRAGWVGAYTDPANATIFVAIIGILIVARLAMTSALTRSAQNEAAANRAREATESAAFSLRESEEQFRQVAEHIPEIVFLAAGDLSHVLYINGAFEEVTGYPPEAIMDEMAIWFKMIHPEDQHRIDEAVSAALAAAGPFDETYRILRKDGGTRWVQVRALTIPAAGGRPARIVGVARDVTRERAAVESDRRATALEAAAAERARFANAVAHELNNSLTPIVLRLALLDMVVEERSAEERKKAVAGLGRTVDRLTALVRDVLDVSRADAGSLRMQKASADVGKVVEENVVTFRPKFESANVALDLHLDGALPAVIDAGRVTQVVVNFLTNALKYSPAGGRVMVETGRIANEAIVRVRDDGPGLTPGQIDRLFLPFEQVHTAPGVQKAGTGLGLYVSKIIIEQHGGRVGCESAGPGHGSTFWFALPLASEDVVASADEPPPVSIRG